MTDHHDPVIRTAPRPSDINNQGNIFGGWVLAQMDTAGGITAARRARGPVATVAIEAMKFHTPILVGDLVSCYTSVEKIGRTSIHVKIDVIADRPGQTEEVQVTEGMFIFVAIGKNGSPRPVEG